MTELELIVDFHKDAEPQGPGSKEETLRALELTGLAQNKDLKIADIGCGTGSHTIHLALNTQANIVGVDLFPEFLNKLRENTAKQSLNKRVSTLEKSMDDLPFNDEEFDIIWSEGAIYNIGFEAGVKDWKRFLKPGGYLCVSEITWITDSRPKKLEDYWMKEYPEIDKASNKISFLESNGFTLTGYFYLNQESWTKNYYVPMKTRFALFLERHNHSDLAKRIVKEYQNEMDQYHAYKEFYSYGFYVVKKDG